jgi:hypothetical protein
MEPSIAFRLQDLQGTCVVPLDLVSVVHYQLLGAIPAQHFCSRLRQSEMLS